MRREGEGNRPRSDFFLGRNHHINFDAGVERECAEQLATEQGEGFHNGSDTCTIFFIAFAHVQMSPDAVGKG